MFNATRLIVLLETEPQSCRFEQIMLNQEQFKKLTDVLLSFFPVAPIGHGHDLVTAIKPVVKIPDEGVEDFYLPEEISKNRI